MTYKHTLRLRRESRLVRFYLWLYFDAEVEKIDFCKLFWGIILSPAVLLFIGVLCVFIFPIAWLGDRADERKRTRPKVSVDTPSRLGESLSRPGPRRLARALLIAIGGVVGVGLLGLIGWALYAVIASGAILYILAIAIAISAIVGLLALVIRAERRGRLDGLERILATSYYALKTNTCPKVEVE